MQKILFLPAQLLKRYKNDNASAIPAKAGQVAIFCHRMNPAATCFRNRLKPIDMILLERDWERNPVRPFSPPDESGGYLRSKLAKADWDDPA